MDTQNIPPSLEDQPETWLPVLGFEGKYEVSDMGRVRSLTRTVPGKKGHTQVKKGKVLRPYISRTGYPAVHLKDCAHLRNITVHRLVMEAFRGPCPEGYECAHNDGVRSNARLTNLRYDTRKGNHADKLTHGTWQGGDNSPAARLTALKVRAIFTLLELGWSMTTLADIFDVDRTTIGLIKSGRNWSHVTGAHK